MLSERQAVGKLYGIRAVIDGMIASIEAKVLTGDKALDTVAAVVAKALREISEPSGPD